MRDPIELFVERLSRNPRTAPSVSEVRRLPAQDASYGSYPASIAPQVRRALERRGVEQPWSHQAQAWEAIDRGQDVVVVTPTASGKTLCYNGPITSLLSQSDDGCALYLYPTKALSQDQCAELNALLQACELDEEAQVYDGDTPTDIRRRVRDTTRAVLTNPDMLHASILPHHDKWRRFFSSLRYVVVDEIHSYRGVFGSHVANVFRRLRRICAHYGSNPKFVFTSATIANPGELAEAMTGRPATVIDRSGAPVGERIFALFNPPIVDAELQRRQSPGAAARRLVSRLVREGHHTIVFARSRSGVERVTRMLKETFERSGEKRLARATTGYRGGYLPEERRQIERDLRAGEIVCVVSTNALELGIDIGSLDACVIAGYPGTIASTWQQAGRAGRRQTTSLSLLIAGDNPVDQYLINHPDYFFGAPAEHARIDPDNLRILSEHLKCAVFELPFGFEEGFGGVPVELVQDVLGYLAEEASLLTPHKGAWRWSTEAYPASTFSLRDILDENFVIIDTTHAKQVRVLGEIDFESAHKTVYPNAIYAHAAQLYEVHRLDYADRKAYVRTVNPEYYTQAIDETRVFVLDHFEEDEPQPLVATRGWGEVRVVTRFTGYKKLRFKTNENIGYGEIQLPDLEKHTTAYWVEFPSRLLAGLGLDATALSGGIHGVAQALHTVAQVHLMCSVGDIHTTVGSSPYLNDEPNNQNDAGFTNPQEAPSPIQPLQFGSAPTVFLHDHCPGGVGFSEKLFAMHVPLLRAAHELIQSCPCSDGCPSCVGPRELVTPQGKAAAQKLLHAVLDGHRH